VLEHLVRVSINGSALKDFDFVSALDYWKALKKRRF
jgi:hypothetical protein